MYTYTHRPSNIFRSRKCVGKARKFARQHDNAFFTLEHNVEEIMVKRHNRHPHSFTFFSHPLVGVHARSNKRPVILVNRAWLDDFPMLKCDKIEPRAKCSRRSS